VFPEDRRHAEAYAIGGIDAERAERDLIRKENNETNARNHKAFKDMMRRAREEKRASDEMVAKAEAELRGETYVAPMPVDENAENRIPNSMKAEAVEEPKIYEVVDDDANDQPPELEQVDIEAEREKIQKQKD